MKLSVKGLATAIAILTGGCLLFVGLFELAFPGYGGAFLDLVASIYPGYHGPDGIGSVIVVTLYGLVDGAIGGAVMAWLYNWATRTKEA
jgi:hypothetical protein